MEYPVSKSQKKREAARLQELGVSLIALADDALASLPLTPQLHQAIVDARAIKAFGAIRRQAQLIGKLMRSADTEAIIAAYESIKADSSAQTAYFHSLEVWRERLLQDDPQALTDFLHEYPDTDKQKLRHLLKKAKDEQELPGADNRALFRFLRACTQ